ncbi:MAG: hypothetical protein RIS45_974 [Planctomycetota bacterium]|jgi:hypothetical protein
MIDPGELTRVRFHAAMQTVAVGAQLARRRTWTVVRAKGRATGVELTLRSGRRSVTVHVPVCITGPDLGECGLRSVALPPSQRVLALQPGGER